MADNGEEKLIAVARHIAKTLGHTDTMTDDILQIFSNFDGRLREKLTEKFTDDHPEQILVSLDRQISRYVSADYFVWSNSNDSVKFLHAVDELMETVSEWTSLGAKEKSIISYLDRAEDLLQQAMFRLEDEFKNLMVESRSSVDSDDDNLSEEEMIEEEYDHIPVAHPIVDYSVIIEAFPSATVEDLREIAKRMVAAGYEQECLRMYSACRRTFLDESLSRLGLQKKLSTDEVHKMNWSELEDEIEKWIKAINVTIRILFPSERRLCDRIFQNLGSTIDLSYMEICRGSTVQLLNFADAVVNGSRAPERLFKVLDVYEAVRDLMPEFELVFSDLYCLPLKNEAISVCKRIGEAIRGIFMELENLIRRDPAKSAVHGGGLHPITRYVMNYLRAACRSRITLEHVFDENIGGDYRKGDSRERALSSSSLKVEMEWIMELLESNLEAKSKIYKDSGLCSIFMMNNVRYIVQKVKDNELGSILGEDWFRKHSSKVRQNHSNYQRSWNKVLEVLKIDNNPTSPSGYSKSLKEKLKMFNSYFDEICKTQLTWVVFDEQLREELKISTVKNLSLAYRNFIGILQSNPDVWKNTDRYVKYSVDDLEARINTLFQGSSGSK